MKLSTLDYACNCLVCLPVIGVGILSQSLPCFLFSFSQSLLLLLNRGATQTG